MRVIDIKNQLPIHSQKQPAIRKLNKIKQIVIHTTDWDTNPKRVAEYDINPNHICPTGNPTCTYHEFIMKDGVVNLAVGPEVITWHAGKWNPTSYAVALMFKCSDKDGNDVYAPTALAVFSLVERLTKLCFDLKVTPNNIFGHRELEGSGYLLVDGKKQLRKTCPSMQVNLDEIRRNVTRNIQTILNQTGKYKLKVDGLYGPKTELALEAYWS